MIDRNLMTESSDRADSGDANDSLHVIMQQVQVMVGLEICIESIDIIRSTRPSSACVRMCVCVRQRMMLSRQLHCNDSSDMHIIFINV